MNEEGREARESDGAREVGDDEAFPPSFRAESNASSMSALISLATAFSLAVSLPSPMLS